jgi:hypothetical protein
MEHLRRMGEGTAALNRQYAVPSDTFLAMASLYQGESFDYSLRRKNEIKACSKTFIAIIYP